MGKGNIQVGSQKDQWCVCNVRGQTFATTKGTIFYRLRYAPELMIQVLVLLAYGCPIQAVVKVFGLEERTVRDWHVRAGKHCEQVHEHLIESTVHDLKQAQAISDNLAYLKKCKGQIQYPQFQAHGRSIGSGIVESGNTLVVEARLKGSGMHWAETHVNPMLTLRNIICYDRWKEEWPKIETRLRQQTRQRRVRLRQSRLASLPIPSPTGRVPSLDAAVIPALMARLEREDSPTKPKSNSWRNFKHGKALIQRSLPPRF